MLFRSFSRTRSDHYHSTAATVGSFNDGPRINDKFFNCVAQPDKLYCSGWHLPLCTLALRGVQVPLGCSTGAYSVGVCVCGGGGLPASSVQMAPVPFP